MNKHIEKKKIISKNMLAFITLFFEAIAITMLFLFIDFLNDPRAGGGGLGYYSLIFFLPVVIFKIVILVDAVFYIKKSKQLNNMSLIILYSFGILIIPFYMAANIIYIKKYLNDKTSKKETGSNMTEAEFQKPNSVEVTYVTASYKTDKFKKFQDRMSNNYEKDE